MTQPTKRSLRKSSRIWEKKIPVGFFTKKRTVFGGGLFSNIKMPLVDQDAKFDGLTIYSKIYLIG